MDLNFVVYNMLLACGLSAIYYPKLHYCMYPTVRRNCGIGTMLFPGGRNNYTHTGNIQSERVPP